jgi:hypothetical protein
MSRGEERSGEKSTMNLQKLKGRVEKSREE